MIEVIKVTNYLGETLTLDLRHPERVGLFVFNVEGLGPAKANINISETAMDDGGRITSTRLDARNIVMTLGFHDSHDVEESRLKTYKYFPIKKRVKLTFISDRRTSEIYGNVESNDPEVFNYQTATQISIICPDPYFYSLSDNVTVFSGVESLFEFPLENPSLTENLIEISALRLDQEQTVVYKGDAEVGVHMHIHAIGSVKGLTIHNVYTREQMSINHDKLVTLTGSGISNRDTILITTTRSQKGITLLRDGEYFNILNALDRGTDWFKLTKGDNVFVYTADEGDRNLQFRITNKIAYEGV